MRTALKIGYSKAQFCSLQSFKIPYWNMVGKENALQSLIMPGLREKLSRQMSPPTSFLHVHSFRSEYSIEPTPPPPTHWSVAVLAVMAPVCTALWVLGINGVTEPCVLWQFLSNLQPLHSASLLCFCVLDSVSFLIWMVSGLYHSVLLISHIFRSYPCHPKLQISLL